MHNQYLYGQALGFVQEFKIHRIGSRELIKKLQVLFPFNFRFLRKDTWTVIETTINYYGLDADEIFKTFERYAINDLIYTIDEEKIFELLSNCRKHKVCNIGGHVVLKELIPFFKEKGVPVPEHFQTIGSGNLINQEDVSSGEIAIENTLSDQEIKKIIKNFDLKKFSTSELGILQARVVAAVFWKKEENLSQTDIIEAIHFIEHMKNFYNLAEVENSEQKTMRTEWISNLDPRVEKTGRPKKSI